MDETYIELLIKKKLSPMEKVQIILIAVLTVLLSAASFFIPYIRTIALLFIAGLVYGSYYLITSFAIEYEYSITNGEMDMDKIIAKRKRSRIITVKLREIESIGKYSKNEHENKRYDTKLFVCADEHDPQNSWYMTLRHNKMQHTLVVFTPDEKVLKNIRKYIPKQVDYDVFVRNRLG